jgi:hypothetical protein
VHHAGFLSLLYILFFCESLPFCEDFLFRKLEASRELDSGFGQIEVKFGLGEVMDLLFFRE